MEASRDGSMDDAITSVEEQIGVLFARARAGWKDDAEQVHHDLQPAGFKLLATLVRGGPTHAGALAETLLTDKSVISRQVRLMEGMGLIESLPDEKDGRARILRATPAAVEKVTALRSTNRARFREVLGAWSEEELRTFADLLGRLTKP